MSGLSGGAGTRFTSQNQTTDQRLSNNTVGLVELSDFRKRRAEVLEQQEREAREAAVAAKASSAAAEAKEAASAAAAASGADGEPAKKKKKKSKAGGPKRKAAPASKLSFVGEDDDEEAEGAGGTEGADEAADEAAATVTTTPTPAAADDDDPPIVPVLKSFTKQALRRQAAEREALRKEFLARQAAVKATAIAVPFVFYEGANIPGGVVQVKKGDPVWLFLDRSRKVGARLGVGAGGGSGGSDTTAAADRRPSKAQMHWARINVDDLMVVRGNLIIPHHFDFYYFIINKTLGPGGVRVFDYSDEPPPAATDAAAAGPGGGGGSSAGSNSKTPVDDTYAHLEGANDDPGMTKVVDRRWYERNKHIFPASVWQEFDPEQDYTQQVRRDQGGNAYFFVGK